MIIAIIWWAVLSVVIGAAVHSFVRIGRIGKGDDE
jgi:predicted secreted protein